MRLGSEFFLQKEVVNLLPFFTCLNGEQYIHIGYFYPFSFFPIPTKIRFIFILSVGANRDLSLISGLHMVAYTISGSAFFCCGKRVKFAVVKMLCISPFSLKNTGATRERYI